MNELKKDNFTPYISTSLGVGYGDSIYISVFPDSVTEG